MTKKDRGFVKKVSRHGNWNQPKERWRRI